MTDSIIPKDFYVYTHRKATTGEIFYVGKGCGRRAWATERNHFWKKVFSKHGRVVEIVRDGLQEWAAFELEQELVALYGRRNLGLGPLTNLSDGGEGPKGRVVTQAQREVNRAIQKQRFLDPAVRARQAETTRKTFENDSTLRTRITQTRNKWLAKPGVREQIGKRALQYYESNPAARARAAEKTRRQFADPAQREAARQRAIKQTSSSEARAATAKRFKDYYENNPAAREAVSKRNSARMLSNKDHPLHLANEERKRPVVCNSVLVFDCPASAAKWLADKGKTKGQVKTVKSRIRDSASGLTQTAYGYTWRYFDPISPM